MAAVLARLAALEDEVSTLRKDAPAPAAPAQKKSKKKTSRQRRSEEKSTDGRIASPVAETGPTGQAVATADYPAVHPGDLAMATGDQIVLLEAVGPEWYRGRAVASGQTGIFPQNHVVVQKALPEGPSGLLGAPGVDGDPAHAHRHDHVVVAHWSFAALHPGDLELAAGDVITCYDKADADWLHGTSQLTGETGLFPANHVHLHPVGMADCTHDFRAEHDGDLALTKGDHFVRQLRHDLYSRSCHFLEHFSDLHHPTHAAQSCLMISRRCANPRAPCNVL